MRSTKSRETFLWEPLWKSECLFLLFSWTGAICFALIEHDLQGTAAGTLDEWCLMHFLLLLLLDTTGRLASAVRYLGGGAL